MRFTLFVIFLFSFSLSAFSAAEEEAGEVQSSVVDNKENLVKGRFLARWNALIARDFDKAYTFESAEYRASIDANSYTNSYHSDLMWNSVKIDEVRIEDESKAVVSYQLSFTFKTGWDMVLESTDFHTEEWFFEDGEWWHDKSKSASPYSV